MKATNLLKGSLFAFGAAAANGSIGVLSKDLMSSGISVSEIAFLKTFLGCAVLFFAIRAWRAKLGSKAMFEVAICAFFGIFILYFFETAAYENEYAANVVVLLMSSATISAIILSRIVLGIRISKNTFFGAAMTVAGISIIMGAGFGPKMSPIGSIQAILAGFGYGAFTVLVKKFKLRGGLLFTQKTLFYGSLYLLLSGVLFSSPEPSNYTYSVAILLLALAIFPTILGFFFTSKALNHLSPGEVQILELSEPLFAAAFAYILLSEIPGENTLIGGAIILLGIAISRDEIVRLIYRKVIGKGAVK